MKDLILLIAKSLINKFEEVGLRELVGGKTIILELRMVKGDLIKLIGEQGKTDHSMRTPLNATSNKSRKRAVLEFIE